MNAPHFLMVPYLDVVVAQQTALLAEIAAAQAKLLQLQNTTNLALDVGGGWSMADLPTERGVLPFEPLDVLWFDREPRPDGTGQGGNAVYRPAR